MAFFSLFSSLSQWLSIIYAPSTRYTFSPYSSGHSLELTRVLSLSFFKGEHRHTATKILFLCTMYLFICAINTTLCTHTHTHTPECDREYIILWKAELLIHRKISISSWHFQQISSWLHFSFSFFIWPHLMQAGAFYSFIDRQFVDLHFCYLHIYLCWLCVCFAAIFPFFIVGFCTFWNGSWRVCCWRRVDL